MQQRQAKGRTRNAKKTKKAKRNNKKKKRPAQAANERQTRAGDNSTRTRLTRGRRRGAPDQQPTRRQAREAPKQRQLSTPLCLTTHAHPPHQHHSSVVASAVAEAKHQYASTQHQQRHRRRCKAAAVVASVVVWPRLRLWRRADLLGGEAVRDTRSPQLLSASPDALLNPPPPRRRSSLPSATLAATSPHTPPPCTRRRAAPRGARPPGEVGGDGGSLGRWAGR